MKKTIDAWIYHFEHQAEPDLRTLAFTESDAHSKAISIIADPSYFWRGPYGKTVPIKLTIEPNSEAQPQLQPRYKKDDYTSV